MNDLFVLELLGPLSDPGEVARMCRRLEIEPTVDAHLTWIAKKAVLEGVPDGWQRRGGDLGVGCCPERGAGVVLNGERAVAAPDRHPFGGTAFLRAY